MFKIKCLNAINKNGLSALNGKFRLTDEIDAADGILLRSYDLRGLIFSPNLKAIARAGVGVNNIPVERCTEAGIPVFNTPGANANGVKELVIAGLLLASRDIIGGIRFVKENLHREDLATLVEKEKSRFAGCEIQGKKLGVIGLGSIGVLVANAGWNMNMEVYGYDPFISVDHAWRLSRHIINVNSLADILAGCDYISLHVPLSKETERMIGRDAFQKMKDGVVLLNFARDALVDNDALEEALRSGKVKNTLPIFPITKSPIWIMSSPSPIWGPQPSSRRITARGWRLGNWPIIWNTGMSSIPLISRNAKPARAVPPAGLLYIIRISQI